jgi:dTDP-4-dehydrorhamnose 3,5-epimerase-like enzyme
MQPKWQKFDIKGDERGYLIALEQYKSVPFDIKRIYYIFGTTAGVRRGYHAHKKLKQMAVCVAGQCKIFLDNGCSSCDVELVSPHAGLFIDPMIWHEMYDFSPDCVLMFFVNDYYLESDYIRDYTDFIREVKDASG